MLYNWSSFLCIFFGPLLEVECLMAQKTILGPMKSSDVECLALKWENPLTFKVLWAPPLEALEDSYGIDKNNIQTTS